MYFFIFIVSFLSGIEFPFAARLLGQGGAGTTAALYTADLTGAAIGAFLAGMVLLPALGTGPTLGAFLLIKTAGVIKYALLR